ncbi:proline racemase family protein [Rhodovibrionaceae bacterium A322]
MQSSKNITVVGCHAEGEVGRVITGGVLPPPGKTLFEQKTYLEEQGDDLRKFLIYEPRGGAFVHTNLVVPPVTPGAQAGFIIMEPTDYPPMSGSNSICVSTVLLETGMVPMQEPITRLKLDTPGGLVEVVAHCENGRVKRITVTNVPSFVAKMTAMTEVEGLGTIPVDISYGGAFFAIVDAQALGFSVSPDEARDLVEQGEKIKAAVVAQHPVVHPENPGIKDVTFTQYACPMEDNPDGGKIGRNAVIISPGKIDRSPCGTGTSARLAVLRAQGKIGKGENFLSKSILDTEFLCRIEDEFDVAGVPAISPSISGRAWLTGTTQYHLDPEDPFPTGYTLSDTWYRAL